ncbi:GNAT family N-acetyltransferase [Geotalea uraniireducens]|nr:GNAT family N-acetyltransferase [Geotalea uraniireducens]
MSNVWIPMENHNTATKRSETIHFRPITDEDMEFLYRLYASTRLTEMAVTGWNETQIEAFLRMQFRLQHMQYMQNYPGASFNIVFIDGTPAGRLYVDRKEDRMLVIDISLLPDFKGKGAGGRILRALVEEADAKGLVMSLHVERSNPILQFYKALGFRELELRGMYYYMERELLN